jgi:inner membrane protein
MTGRTHDLAAFTAMSYVVATQPLNEITLPTVLVSISANFIGGLAPDIDQSTATLWHRFRGGSILGRLITPILGGHRLMSHSIIGIFIFGIVAKVILGWLHTFLLVDVDVVWWAFMIGFISHLIMDSFTREGVYWLFPIPLRLGFPPLGFLRMKTGGLLEKSFVFPMLIMANIAIYYLNYGKFLDLLRHYLK